MVIRRREGHVGAGIHESRRRNVEQRHTLDGERMVEAQPMRDAPAAIVAHQPNRAKPSARINST